MKWLLSLILVLLSVGTCRVTGCGDEGSCGDCNDGDPCTRDYCDSEYVGPMEIKLCDPDSNLEYTCEHDLEPDGTPCGGEDVCFRGQCVENPCGGIDCDDADACTIDECVYADGSCLHTPVQCDPADDCKDVTCDPAAGCTDVPMNEGGVCAPRLGAPEVFGEQGLCESGVCVGQCDPGSNDISQCPIDPLPEVVCCPGSEYCYWFDMCADFPSLTTSRD